MTPLTASESVQRLGRLVRKELVEIFRDRRTIITLVLMPLLLYPLLSVAFQQFFLASSIDPNRNVVYRFGFPSENEANVFLQFLRYGKRIREHREPSMEPAQEQAGAKLVPFVVAEPDKAVRAGEVDLAVRLKNADGFAQPLQRDMVLAADITFLSNNPAALGAMALVERRLAAVHERNLELRLDLPGATPKVALVHVSRNVLAVTGGDSMISLAALVPLILILMTMTGAVYPAIDLTAGERERGTLEILVAAPVPRLSLLFAKYVSVFSVAVLTAVVNLVSMVLTLLFSGLSQVLFAGGGLTPLLVLQLLGLLLLFAAFFSALLLSLTSFARSFKEAQAYLIPLMLASLGPGLIGMMPGIELEGPLAAAPLINIVLLARDLVKGGADPGWAMVVVVTTLAYAAAAITLAARVFGAEGVLYNEQSGWSDLWRRPSSEQPAATLAAALWCLALMIPAYFAMQWFVRPEDISAVAPWNLAADGIVGVVLFAGFPLVSAYLGRVRLSEGFGLAPVGPAALLGALLLGLSLWPLLLQLLSLLPGGDAERAMLLVQIFKDYPALALANVVLHALVEELFFRGYLFGALRHHLSRRATIVVSALLFAHWHLVLGWKQFLPSTLMGLVLGRVRADTGSLFPGMLLHACHNAILVALAIYAPAMDQLPMTWLVVGAMGTCAGAALVWWGSHGPARRTSSET